MVFRTSKKRNEMIPTLPSSYDAWRTMSEDDYHAARERDWFGEDDEEEPDRELDEL